MKIRIVVAVHKPYRTAADPMYLPIQGGRALHEPLPFQGDDTGENISGKNDGYCELTCLYWAWKNLDADAVGLCHYRRYFAGRRTGPRWERVLTQEQAGRLLADKPVVLPRPRRYYIETNYSQYAHAHHGADLDALRQLLAERWPEYLPAYDTVMGRSWGHRWNMFIMRRDILDRYCEWLFAVLFELEGRIDASGYDPYNRRVFGFLAERLLDIWLLTEGIEYSQAPKVDMESQHWPRKIAVFLRRKFARTHE